MRTGLIKQLASLERLKCPYFFVLSNNDVFWFHFFKTVSQDESILANNPRSFAGFSRISRTNIIWTVRRKRLLCFVQSYNFVAIIQTTCLRDNSMGQLVSKKVTAIVKSKQTAWWALSKYDQVIVPHINSLKSTHQILLCPFICYGCWRRLFFPQFVLGSKLTP